MQEPFPHVLTLPVKENNWLLRFVTPKEINPGDIIQEQSMNGVKNTPFKVIEISTRREAKGDWSKWPNHPYYYEAKGRQI